MESRVPNKLKRILAARKKSFIYPSSLSTLAYEAEVNKNTVVNLSDGMYFPKLDTAYKIARALNLSVYDIWVETELREFMNELSEASAMALIRELEADESQED